jgi:hypothetical protein
MTNHYLEEFTEEVSLGEFIDWLRSNQNGFYLNMRTLGKGDEKKQLREWIRWFLSWSEYEDNKE